MCVYVYIYVYILTILTLTLTFMLLMWQCSPEIPCFSLIFFLNQKKDIFSMDNKTVQFCCTVQKKKWKKISLCWTSCSNCKLMALGPIRADFTATCRLLLKKDFTMTNFSYFEPWHYGNRTLQTATECFPQALFERTCTYIDENESLSAITAAAVWIEKWQLLYWNAT